WNIEGASRIEGLRSAGALVRSSRTLTIACVVARLPAVMTVRTRSPGVTQLHIFLKTETLSIPALVRVSDMKTRPLFSLKPTQYVICSTTGLSGLFTVVALAG